MRLNKFMLRSFSVVNDIIFINIHNKNMLFHLRDTLRIFTKICGKLLKYFPYVVGIEEIFQNLPYKHYKNGFSLYLYITRCNYRNIF